jgi:hypothetical protein
MFRFTHPVTYSQHISDFLEARVSVGEPRSAAGQTGV